MCCVVLWCVCCACVCVCCVVLCCIVCLLCKMKKIIFFLPNQFLKMRLPHNTFSSTQSFSWSCLTKSGKKPVRAKGIEIAKIKIAIIKICMFIFFSYSSIFRFVVLNADWTLPGLFTRNQNTFSPRAVQYFHPTGRFTKMG